MQFAVQPETNEIRVIEMNPRVSRSSALASKATGFPIAKLAALLAVGYTLDELPNDITQKTTAAFEPALDYVAVKAPRFDFEKFAGASRAARGGDAGRRRGARDRADVPRGVPEGVEAARCRRSRSPRTTTSSLARAASRSPTAGTSCSSAPRRDLDLPGIHPYFADRLREIATAERDDRQACTACRGLVRRRVRGAHALLLRHPRGRGRGARAVGARGDRARRRAEPDRAGDRVRLLLRPRRAGAPQARLRGGARQLEPGDGLDRLRHLGPALPRAARRAGTSSTSARSSSRWASPCPSGDRPAYVSRPRWRRPACRCSATRSTRSTRPRTAAASRGIAGDLAPEWGVAENAEEAREIAHRLGYPVLVRPAPRARRAGDARRALRRRAPRRGARASSTATSKARSSSTSTRSATARAPGWRPSSSTSSRPASTRATRPASSRARRCPQALEDEIREVASRIAAGSAPAG